ncbi:hypothetical protein BCEN4_740081 [Burkholderia cenocepacia]|nr:hypothetical protein BCEN4_740081 [Burkholderia cenocepacia]
MYLAPNLIVKLECGILLNLAEGIGKLLSLSLGQG